MLSFMSYYLYSLFRPRKPKIKVEQTYKSTSSIVMVGNVLSHCEAVIYIKVIWKQFWEHIWT